MYFAATSMRKTALAEKVYARAAEIDRMKATAKKDAEFAKKIQKAKVEPNIVVVHYRKRSLREVLNACVIYFGVKERELIGPTKPAEILMARQVAHYVAHTYCGVSLPAVGRVFNRDHTTILSSVRKIQKLLDSGDMDVRAHVHAIRLQLCAYDLNDVAYWGA